MTTDATATCRHQFQSTFAWYNQDWKAASEVGQTPTVTLPCSIYILDFGTFQHFIVG